jgi:hypothetical protein
LAAHDLESALSGADALDSTRRQAALLGILPVLVGESPDLALGVADTYADGPRNRFSLVKAAVGSWITLAGTSAAEAFFSRQPISENFDGAYAALASALAATNPGETGTWLNRISDPVQREAATVGVIAQITDSNPEAASRLVSDLIKTTPGDSNEDTTIARLEKTVPSWAAKDPSAAFSYIYSLNSISSPGRKILLHKLGLVGP